MSTAALRPDLDRLGAVIARHWGFKSFRPLQREAMQAVLDGRDSLVVMPTGGGKSLCYQAPAAVRGETTIVVSPLIALMEDQIGSLRSSGVPAAALHSNLSPGADNAVRAALAAGELRLLFVSPERLATAWFRELVVRLGVRTFAIDEAHCISHWGHDFRPEYRQLRELRQLCPAATFHAYTATATEPVRRDIIEQLGLRQPLVLVGNFDRPNLTYRIVRRDKVTAQVEEVLARHRGEAGIIYCITRREVDDLAQALNDRGYRALPYHAGMSPADRKRVSDAFRAGSCDLVVATVAFGM
jgi:ATP-dependent DNA helicase RecQ